MMDSATAYNTIGKKWIHTSKGRRFFVDDPVFDIEEIGHALSHQCRFTGHTRTLYTVAEHSVLVSRLSQEVVACQIREGEPGGFQDPARAAFEGLMHDAHEAYISDLASPWKAMVPDYRAIEHKLETAMRWQYGLPSHISHGVKLADWYALFIEAEDLMGAGVTDDWPVPSKTFREDLRPILNSRYFAPRCMSSASAKRVFLAKFTHLRGITANG